MIELIKFIIKNSAKITIFDSAIIITIILIFAFGIYKIFEAIYGKVIEAHKETIKAKDSTIESLKEQERIIAEQKKILKEENIEIKAILFDLQNKNMEIGEGSEDIKNIENIEGNSWTIIKSLINTIVTIKLGIIEAIMNLGRARQIELYERITETYRVDNKKKVYNTADIIFKYDKELLLKLDFYLTNNLILKKNEVTINTKNLGDIEEISVFIDTHRNEIEKLVKEIDDSIQNIINEV
jgi:hypothetical protein